MRRFAIVIALVASGCDLYFTDKDDECKPVPAAETDFAPLELRDPDTGVCEDLTRNCDARCDPNCDPTADSVILPDWGSCFSQCEGLSAGACMAAPGCFAAYNDWPSQADRTPEFRGCWQTAPSGPISGVCSNLDAYQCSRHDDCIAYYEGPVGGVRTSPVRRTFLACGDEPTIGQSCETTSCQLGSHCEQQCEDTTSCAPTCVPDQNACEAIDCGSGWTCTEVCNGGACGAQCVPAGTCEAITAEGACKTRPDCTTVYLGDDCTCTPTAGCQCEILTYDRCETK